MNHQPPSAHFRAVVSASNRNRGDFVDNLNEAIRQNPVPAALIGAGFIWLFMGGAKNTVLGGAVGSLFSGLGHGAQQAGGLAYRTAQGVGGAIGAGAASVADVAEEAGSQAATASRGVASTLSSVAGETASHVSDTAKAAYRAAGEVVGSSGNAVSNSVPTSTQSVRESGPKVSEGFHQTLADMFSRQPLLLGAVGIAVGAAIAASMPSSNAENRMMGDSAEALKDKAEELWNETAKHAEAVASKGLEEAKSQGLTPETAGKALRGVTEKVVGVVEKTKEGVARQVKGESVLSDGLRR